MSHSSIKPGDWKHPVINRDLNTPPGSPSIGDRYVVASIGTGDWLGHDNEIAEWDGVSWIFEVPKVGNAVFISNESYIFGWDGISWEIDTDEIVDEGENTDITLKSFLSGNNSSIKLLSSGETFTGKIDKTNLPDVMVSCFSSSDGTLFFDFSNDGKSWRPFPVDGYNVTANIHEFHIARKGPRHFRARFVNSATPQTEFQLFVYYGSFGQPMAPIGFTINDDADAIVTKSIISGIGDTTARVTDHRALQVTLPSEGKTAFGEVSIAERTPVIQIKFPYNFVNPVLIKSQSNNLGSVFCSDSMLQVSTGASANSRAEAISIENINYKPGQGVVAKFTGLFTQGVDNSIQTIGIGDFGEGYFFGYNGSSFGILSRKDGVPEVRTLTISAGTILSDTVTITLDGDAKNDVALTAATGNTTVTANDIAAADYSNVGDGWDAVAVGNTVVFTSWTSGAKSGSYSLTDAISAIGSFSQTLQGVSHVDTWINQSNWNGEDKFDGNGLTGVTLYPTKGNVYQIRYKYLGFGAIEFFIEDPDDSEMHLVHSIEYSNANITPSLNNPDMPMFIGSENISNTTDIIVKTGSLSAFVEGKIDIIGPRRSIKTNVTNSGSSEIPIMTLRNKNVFKNTINRTYLKVLLISCAAEHTKPVSVNLYKNTTLVDASFSDINTNSIAQKDSSATSFSGGDFLFTIELGQKGNQILDLSKLEHDAFLKPGETITTTIEPKSGTGSEASVNFYFVELF